MVIVSVHFEVEPVSSGRFERTWRDTFMPAIRAREGFVDCGLLKEWPRETDSATPSERYRLDIIFTTEELRMAWARSPEHEVAFGELQTVVRPTSSMRFVEIA